MIGLPEQTVRVATSLDDAHRRHRWVIPEDYSVVADMLLRHQHRADEPCLIYEDEDGSVQRWSWGAMLKAVNRFANALRGLGVTRGDVVAIYLPQRPENLIAHLAAHRIGALSLPISKLFAPDAVRYRLEHSTAKVMVVEDETAEQFVNFLKEIETFKHLVVVGKPGPGRSFDKLLEGGAESFTVDREPRSDDPYLLMYTSGTTGNPKAVLHHARMLAAHNGIDHFLDFLRPGDLYYSAADWAWVGGLVTGLFAILPHGVPVLASRVRFDPERCLKMAERHGSTVGLYAPTALKRLRELPSPKKMFPNLHLRCIFSGGEAVSPELKRWVREDLGSQFNMAFGQTEANATVGSCCALEDFPIEALGKPMPGHNMKIVNDQGVEMPQGEVGEIALHKDDPVLMATYWRNEAAFAERFRGEWYLTGDTGWQDDTGYLYFQGRIDDVIKTSGYRVGPGEVEAAIISVPGVASCAVIGVPDERVGESIKAFVKVMPGVQASDELTGKIQAHVRTVLAKHEYPREIEYMEEFPMTVTGKIRRRDLREAEIAKRAKKT